MHISFPEKKTQTKTKKPTTTTTTTTTKQTTKTKIKNTGFVKSRTLHYVSTTVHVSYATIVASVQRYRSNHPKNL